jgi:hypothetical protein
MVKHYCKVLCLTLIDKYREITHSYNYCLSIHECQGYKVLSGASQNGFPKIVRLLLDKGADFDATNSVRYITMKMALDNVTSAVNSSNAVSIQICVCDFERNNGRSSSRDDDDDDVDDDVYSGIAYCYESGTTISHEVTSSLNAKELSVQCRTV